MWGFSVRGRWRLAREHLHDRVHGRLTAKRRLAGEQLVKNCAQTVDVGGGRDLLLRSGLLRGHVVGRAQHGASARQIAVAFHARGQAEIGHLRLARCIEQNVARL